jgi:putative membrane protein
MKNQSLIEKNIGERLRGSLLWMFFGILISGITGYIIYLGIQFQHPFALFLQEYFFLPLILELFIIILLLTISYIAPAFILKILFIFYSVVSGFTFSVIGLKYTPNSILMVFISTATIFLVMAIYGYLTKRDITKIGGILFTGLLLATLFLFVNLFLKSSFLDTVISSFMIVFFTGWIAYDVKNIKEEIIRQIELGNEKVLNKVEIIGALNLYLDFVNLFINILNVFGEEK